MQSLCIFIVILLSFGMIALAAHQVGRYFAQVELPLISGFLFAGILAGPFVLRLISAEAVAQLRFVDEIALGFIAFAAGSELYLKELRSRMKSIVWVTAGNSLVIPVIVAVALVLLADWIPFMQPLPLAGRIGLAVVAGAIFVARSPSSAIAIVNELRASGPFTQTTLGVTMVTDVLVIVLFAISASFASSLLTGGSFQVSALGLLVVNLALSVGLGWLLGRCLQWLLGLRLHRLVKGGMILLAGYSVFLLADMLHTVSRTQWPFALFLEPLLICMTCGFVVANYTPYRDEFLLILHEISLPIYIAFFTLTGAALQLDVLAETWAIALVLFLVRIGAIWLGSFGGGVLAGEPLRFNQLGWLTYITQAGVGLGLAKEAADEFAAGGEAFATLVISVIVLGQLVGPLLFKWAIKQSGEAHTRAPTPVFDGVRDAIIFGLDDQAVALARQLQAHGWQVRIATRNQSGRSEAEIADSALQIQLIPAITVEALRALDAAKSDAIVTLLSDQENYQICELVYEQFGTAHVVARLHDPRYRARFQQLGVTLVEPTLATVNLLDHFVRSPSAASLLTGLVENQDVIELDVRNPNVHGLTLRELRLPLDVLVLAVRRNGQMLISHGYTRLELGDRVTVVGSVPSLDAVMLRFEQA